MYIFSPFIFQLYYNKNFLNFQVGDAANRRSEKRSLSYFGIF